MRTRAVLGTLVLGVMVLGACHRVPVVPGVPTPDPDPAPMLELAINPFPAENPCTLGCSAATTVTVTNGGDAPTSTGVDVTVAVQSPATGHVFAGEPACGPSNILDPEEFCVTVLVVGRSVPGIGGVNVPSPGVVTGTVTATSGSDFESDIFSVTLGTP